MILIWTVFFLLQQQVRGELYEVDDKMLEYLDKMEEIPIHYQRLIQTIYLEADNRPESHGTEAFIYQLCNYKDFILELPFIKDYDSYGPHGLQYVSRKYRDKPMSRFEVLKGHWCPILCILMETARKV